MYRLGFLGVSREFPSDSEEEGAIAGPGWTVTYSGGEREGERGRQGEGGRERVGVFRAIVICCTGRG
jgi:hypothetical protein